MERKGREKTCEFGNKNVIWDAKREERREYYGVREDDIRDGAERMKRGPAMECSGGKH